MDKKREQVMGILFIGLNILDAYLTKKALAMGASELNPIAIHFGANIFWKAIIAIAVVVILYFWKNQKLLIPLCIAMAAICTWNFCMILR